MSHRADPWRDFTGAAPGRKNYNRPMPRMRKGDPPPQPPRRRRPQAGRGRMHARSLLPWLATAFALLLAALSARDPGASSADPEAPSATPAPAAASSPFTDVTIEAGIDFVHDNGAHGDFHLHEIMSGGGGFVDFDGDGLLDVFLVQSGRFGTDDPAVTSRLYRNDGDGSFTDVTEIAGAGVGAYGMGCAAMDFDRDGDQDLYITRVGPDVLLRNDGGRFEDVTRALGLGDPAYTCSAAWLDFDRDGWPDLHVTRYIVFSPKAEESCRGPTGERDYCNPTSYPMPAHVLYRNVRGNRFEDASQASGVSRHGGYGLAVAASDLDGDEWVDLYVANDQSRALFWRNQHDGTFVEDGILAGCAYDGDGVAIAGMGIAPEDFDGDGDFDLFVTNIRLHSNLFLRNQGRSFADVSASWARPGWLVPYTGFGTVALDQDHDGRLDLFVANGAVMKPQIPIDPSQPYGERNQFLREDATGRFVDASGEVTPTIMEPAVSRGLARGDYDNDGDVDLLVMRNGARPQLLRNDQHAPGRWITISTEHEDGTGPVLNARVTVEAAGMRRLREVRPHESYVSTNDPRVHFGLGVADSVDRLVVQWPDGSREAWGPLGVDAFFTARRGTGTKQP